MGTKVKAQDIKNQAFLTTGTAPDYEITIPRETAYADMDRMEILVNFHSTGSGTITLNVNGMGAKDTGLTDVTVDDYATFVFDVSQDMFVLVDYSGSSTSGGDGQIIDSTYYTGEDLTKGDFVFLEDEVSETDAINIQNIGNVNQNARIERAIFGSGIQGNTINLMLSKTGTPTVDLGIRIETDDGTGNPSGTLVDANAVGTISESALTNTLSNTIITLSGNITLTEGIKYYIIIFQGNYGSETIDFDNYYSVGYSSVNTTTRGLMYYINTGGTISAKKEEYPGTSIDTSYWNLPTGYITVNEELKYNVSNENIGRFNNVLKSLNTYNYSNISLRCTITSSGISSLAGYGATIAQYMMLYRDDNNYIALYHNHYHLYNGSTTEDYSVHYSIYVGGSEVSHGSVSGDFSDIKLDYNKATGVVRFFYYDNLRTQIGSTETQTYTGDPYVLHSFEANGGGYDKITGANGSIDNTYITNFSYDTEFPVYTQQNNKRIYTNSDIILNNILSKTDGTYSYKTNRLGLSIDNYNISTKPNLIISGIDNMHSGLIYGNIMYIDNIPGLISNTPGINSSPVGKSISNNKILLNNYQSNIKTPIDMTNGTIYTAETDGFVVLSVSDAANNSNAILRILGGESGTMELAYGVADAGFNTTPTITAPILKGRKYSGVVTGDEFTIRHMRFYPMGI